MSDDERWRRQEKSRETTRAALLDAARRLWAERGIQGASLNDVAVAAGLTKGAVYSNFTGKADLLLALLERQTQEPSLLDGPGAGGLVRRLWQTDDENRPPPARRRKEREERERQEDREQETERVRLLTLLLVELWSYGMRDYSAGWRIADWYHAIRQDLARDFAARDGLGDGAAQDRATMVIAMDLGLLLQHLLDPARVPPGACAAGMRLVLEP